MREPSGASPGLASLPSGGGGVSALGDRFQPDIVRGTGNYTIPINCPKGPNELQPTVKLTYSTGSGNGPFGMGWRLDGLLRIERRSDRGIPAYTDDDTFVIGDVDTLVHVGDNRYRRRTDNEFWLIEKNGDSWRIRTGDGRTMTFGSTADSRETGPAGTFAWHLDEQRDPAGNAVTIRYRRDQRRLYPQRIDWSIFSLRFRYEARPDVVRNARAGHVRATALRARGIELHCERLDPTTMRTYSLSYEQAANGASLLSGVSLTATADGRTASMPELAFGYSALDLDAWEIAAPTAVIAPPALDDASTQLVDLTGDGVADVVQSVGGRMLVWRNDGDGAVHGPASVAGIPSTVSLERDSVALADLNGNGRVDLFAVDQPLGIAFENTGRGAFAEPPIVFERRASVGLADADVRLMDVDGDGVIDLLRAGRSHFLLYPHEPGRGFGDPDPVRRISDLDAFPDVSLSDRGVRLADMTGDGLQDVVVVHGGHVSYWPYLGNGRWDRRVEMAAAPVFEPGYRDDRVHVIDVDGDGCADVVYVGSDSITIWLNRAGRRFASPHEIPVGPPPGRKALFADLFGDGRPGLAWSTAPRADDDSGLRQLRLDAGRKPYLMTSIDNGMGGRYEIDYSTSTLMRVRDRAEGHDWPHPLPFVVHVVERIREIDTVDARVAEMSFAYHDGVYDGLEREFRGFGRVEITTNGDESVPASRQEVTFFHGDPEEIDLAARERARALSGALLGTRTYEATTAGFELRDESRQTWDARIEFEGAGRAVYFPFVAEIETREHAPGAPVRTERSRLTYDAHGNPASRSRVSVIEGEPPERAIQTEERFVFTADEARWLVRLPVSTELRDAGGTLFAATTTYYDGDAFVGLPEGRVEAGLVTRVQELKLVEARLPAGYLDGRDLGALGYRRRGAGADRGWYATTTSVRRDARGNVIAQRDPLGNETHIDYDGDGVYPDASRDARGNETTLEFNPRAGEPARLTLPDGRRIRYEHDPIGRLAATFETDDDGNEQLVKAWAIDTAAPASATSFAPRAAGTSFADLVARDPAALEDVSVSRAYYDGFGNELVQVSTAPDGPGGPRRFVTSERRVLNVRGLAAAAHGERFVTDLSFPAPAGLDPPRVRYRYDVRGNVADTAGPGPFRHKVVRATTTIEHFEGPAAGDLGTPATAGPASRVERFDARDRLVGIDEFAGDGTMVTTSYELTLDGQIEVIRDGSGAEATRYAFGGPGKPVRIVNRDAGTRTYYRDAADRLLERVDADGSRLLHTYDAMGRLVTIDHVPAGGSARRVREIVYDADPSAPGDGRFLHGRVALIREGSNEFRFSYNRSGRKVAEEIAAGGATLTLRRRYDLQGELTAIVYPDGHTVEYQRDASGSVGAVDGVASGVTYDPDGAVTGYDLANGVSVRRRYDAESRLLGEVAATRGAAPLRAVRFVHDAAGNVTGYSDRAGPEIEHWRFAYDGLYRITGFEVRRDTPSGPVVRTGGYAYSETGDLVSFDEGEAHQHRYDDPAHPGRLTAVEGAPATTGVAYDDLGNVSQLGDLNIDYDAFGRVERAERADGAEVRFTYDAQGRRVTKQVVSGGDTTTTVYVEGLYERTGDRAIRHVYLKRHLIASQRTGAGAGAAFYLTDHHGTVLLATNAAGAVVANQRYLPFGRTVDASIALDRYLGRQSDPETGLLHLGARYYAPAIGRFISPDWYVLEDPSKPVKLPQGYNVYAYAMNNPIVFKDPSGMWFFIGLAIAAAVGFVVGFVTGLIVGLANGQGWGSLLTALETGLVTAFGAMIGFSVGALLGPGAAVFFGLMAGMNGVISGAAGIYDWGSWEGWGAFLSDSSWGLIGTTLGNIVHVVNLFWPNSNYRHDLSHRQNRHVYEGGMRLKNDFAFTMGNVISNAGQGGKGINASFIANHEELHVWQSRIFGPLFQLTYVVWGVGGFIVASVYWLFNTDEDWGSLVETAAYYDNPFEYWAYDNDNNWPPSGVNPSLAWG